MAKYGIEGIGELGGGGVLERVVVEIIEDGAGAFDQFEVEVGEQAIEAAVLLIEEAGSELVFGGGPFLQGLNRDFEF